MKIIYNENNYLARQVAEKISKAKPGAAIPFSPEELNLFLQGQEVIILSKENS